MGRQVSILRYTIEEKMMSTDFTTRIKFVWNIRSKGNNFPSISLINLLGPKWWDVLTFQDTRTLSYIPDDHTSQKQKSNIKTKSSIKKCMQDMVILNWACTTLLYLGISFKIYCYAINMIIMLGLHYCTLMHSWRKFSVNHSGQWYNVQQIGGIF